MPVHLLNKLPGAASLTDWVFRISYLEGCYADHASSTPESFSISLDKVLTRMESSTICSTPSL